MPGEAITITISAYAAQALKEFDKTSKGLRAMSDRMRDMGTTLSMGLTVPLAAVGGAALKMAADFDLATREVTTLTTGTIGQMGGMREELLRMSTQVPESAVELSRGLYETISAGITNVSDAENVLRVSAKAAVAGMSDTFTAVDAITTVLNAYQLDASQASRVSDAFFETIKLGKVTFPELAQSIGQVATTAALAGIPIEQLGAMIATMTKFGFPAQESAYSLNRAFLTLVNTTPKAAAAAKALGLDWSIAGLQAHGFAALMQQLNKATDGNIERLAKIIPQVRAFRPISILGGQGLAEFNKELVEFHNDAGMGQTAFEKMMGASWNTAKVVKNQLNVALIELGDTVLPQVVAVLADTAKAVLPVMQGFTELFGELPGWVRGGTVAILALGAALGPVLFTASLLTKAMSFLAGANGLMALSAAKATTSVAAEGAAAVETTSAVTALAEAQTAAATATVGVAAAATGATAEIGAATVATGILAGATGIGLLIIALGELAYFFHKAKEASKEAGLEWARLLKKDAAVMARTSLDQAIATYNNAKAQVASANRDLALVRAGVKKVAIPEEYGGGFRTLQTADQLNNSIIRTNALAVKALARVQALSKAGWQSAEDEARHAKTAAERAAAMSVAFTTVYDVSQKLAKSLKDSQQELYQLTMTQDAFAAGSDEWNKIGKSIDQTRQKIEETEGALRKVNTQLAAMTQAFLAANKMSGRGFGVPSLAGMPGVAGLAYGGAGWTPFGPNVVGTYNMRAVQVPTGLHPSLAAQLRTHAAGVRAKSAQKADYGLTPQLYAELVKEAKMAGESTRALAERFGLVAKTAKSGSDIIITSVGSMVQAWINGTNDIGATMISMFTQIGQDIASHLPGGGPLAAVIGALGGIIGALFHHSQQKQTVVVDSYGSGALAQQEQLYNNYLNNPPQAVILQFVDPNTGQVTSQTLTQLYRLEARDAVSRNSLPVVYPPTITPESWMKPVQTGPVIVR